MEVLDHSDHFAKELGPGVLKTLFRCVSAAQALARAASFYQNFPCAYPSKGIMKNLLNEFDNVSKVMDLRPYLMGSSAGALVNLDRNVSDRRDA